MYRQIAILIVVALFANTGLVQGQSLGRPVTDTGPRLDPAQGFPGGTVVGQTVNAPVPPAKPATSPSIPGLLPLPDPRPLTAPPPVLRTTTFADPTALPTPAEPKLSPMPPATSPMAPMPIPSSAPTGPGAEKPAATPESTEKIEKPLYDSLHQDDCYGFKSLFDSLHPEGAKGKHWYEKLSLRGYSQFRYGRTLIEDQGQVDPRLLGDRSIDGSTEGFSIRRARLILSGDVSDHLGLYFQPDFGNIPASGSTSTFFAQLRDLYGDVYVDKEKVHRFRVGLSKVPYGFENLQSSQNRVPLDRTDPLNSAVAPNERDLGIFYYFTPEEQQKMFRDLVDGGLKGSGNYGIFGIGIYSGQGGSQIEQNEQVYGVARATYPWQLPSGQVFETSVQAYTGRHVVRGAKISPLGEGKTITPAETDNRGHLDQRVAGTFVWYPQPFGFQTEWNVGRGPGLNDAQDEVITRSLSGGYLMAMYKLDTPAYGIFTPYARYQYFKGGYRSLPNAPYGEHKQWDLGVEWQMRKELELVVEYSLVDGATLNSIDKAGERSFENFKGGILRFQFQINY